MRASDRNVQSNLSAKEVFGVNLHDFIEKQEGSSMYELASEFGLSLGDVRKLKRQLNRS